jgi:hypothetical protein
MAVTVTTHTQAGTWTAVQLRTLFETSFIANGIMTAWYDSFSSGSCELGIVERVLDGAKTYGTVYYVFKFSTTDVMVYDCDSWDAVNHVPDGTQDDTFVRGYSFSTAAGSNGDYGFMHVVGGRSDTTSRNYGDAGDWDLAPATTVELRCFTSGDRSSFKFFQLKNGNNFGSFCFPQAAASYIDLDTFMYNGLISCNGLVFNNVPSLVFPHVVSGNRRSAIGGSVAGVDTSVTIGDAAYCSVEGVAYRLPTSYSTGASNSSPAANGGTTAFRLPLLRAAQLVSGPVSDLYYLYMGVLYSYYEALPNLPSDFGIYMAEDGNTTIVNNDTLVVSSGVEEYQVLHACPASSTAAGYSWMAFVARTV